MNYNDFIQNIIDTRGQWNIPKGEYFEVHHILPRCLGGLPKRSNRTSKHDNLIWLYAREHYIAHKLLAEENPDNIKLVSAYWHMCNRANENSDLILTPEEYEEAKLIYSEARSLAMKEYWQNEENTEAIEERNKKISIYMSGDNNPAKQPEARIKIAEANSNRIWTAESRHNMSLAKKGHHDNVGFIMPDYAKEKISMATKGANNPRARKILCIETNELFGCMKDACIKYSYNKKTLRKACLDITKTAYGYH